MVNFDFSNSCSFFFKRRMLLAYLIPYKYSFVYSLMRVCVFFPYQVKRVISIQQIQALWVCFYIVWWLTLFSSFWFYFLIHRSYCGDIITHVNAFVLVLNEKIFGGILFHLSTDGGLFQLEKFATQFSCLFAVIVVVVDWWTCFRRNVYILTKKKINYIQ